MKRLFLVRIRDRYDQYYVLASDFNDAAIKAKEKFTHEQSIKPLLNREGDLNMKEDEIKCQIGSVEYLTDEVVL